VEYSVIRSTALLPDLPTNCTLNSLTNDADRVLTSTSSSLLHGFSRENLEKLLGVAPRRRSTVVRRATAPPAAAIGITTATATSSPPRAPPSWSDIVVDPASFSDLLRARERAHSLIDPSTGLVDLVGFFFLFGISHSFVRKSRGSRKSGKREKSRHRDRDGERVGATSRPRCSGQRIRQRLVHSRTRVAGFCAVAIAARPLASRHVALARVATRVYG